MANESILVIDDEEIQREALAGHLSNQGFQVLIADNGKTGVELLQQNLVDLILTDFRMPDMTGLQVLQAARQLNPEIEVVIITAYGSVGGAVDAMHEGACHYLEKPIDLEELDQVIARALEHHHLVSENRLLKAQLREQNRFDRIVSVDPAMEEPLNMVARAAPSRATVLIRGESGTGKELVARAIHEASPRRDKPFIAVNCAALNKQLIESELFGHEKGAFTGATEQRQGRFEQAHGGTLFIDEVAEIPAEVQVKLLRILQERTIERVGGGIAIEVDVRLISATHQNLEQRIQEGTFREDLFYRLNVVAIELPPLRQRRRDIPLLAEHFLTRYSTENAKQIRQISKEAMDLLMRHAYPGNVRELQNLIERAVVMARDEVIAQTDLPPEMRDGRVQAPVEEATGTLPAQVETLERTAIDQALKETHGVQSRAAQILGITERNLRYKLKKYGLK
jgi:two-component system NtrC family response regulator